jgi:hypothetical protein
MLMSTISFMFLLLHVMNKNKNMVDMEIMDLSSVKTYEVSDIY